MIRVTGWTLKILVTALAVVVSLALAYLIRFEGEPRRLFIKQFLLVVPYLVLLRLLLYGAFGVFQLSWRYISMRDLPRILGASLAGTGVLVAARFGVAALVKNFDMTLNPAYSTIPFGVLAIELVLSTAAVIAVCLTRRASIERPWAGAGNGRGGSAAKQRALVVGAGSAGVMVAREVAANPQVGFTIAGFLDDDPGKHGSIIQGIHVLGPTERLAELAQASGASLVVIAMARAPAQTVRRIVGLAEAASLQVKIIPGLYEIISGQVNISKIRQVEIEDLLGREPVQLEEEAIAAFLSGKTVLVTGAGGSIGSEICRQICRYRPRRLVLLDQAENPIFHIHRELQRLHPEVPFVQAIGTIAERERVRQVLLEHRPEVIFHAAAHKHVPLMEMNPGEAVRNNVLGTRNVAELADELGAEAFVMISTDKAVNPTSVMGASKRLAEMYVQAAAAGARTRLITVRFGNVLGSEGSVVPLFKEQIARGGPVTITHPEMKRYFMTIPEAAQLVLEAAAMGRGGEIFVLEMGEPILIANLARDLIRLSGYRPDEDIRIELTGMRPGEKLYEEINLSEENAAKTRHPRIWIGKGQAPELADVRRAIDELLLAVPGSAEAALRRALAGCVPEYHPEDLEAAAGQQGAGLAGVRATAPGGESAAGRRGPVPVPLYASTAAGDDQPGARRASQPIEVTAASKKAAASA